MSIPFARQHDKGTYQCGYQIAGEQQRIFVEGGVTVNFKGMYIVQCTCYMLLFVAIGVTIMICRLSNL